jgi:predicted RNA-binding Zn-ribbon protein involved in translation (DUF1610 family)
VKREIGSIAPDFEPYFLMWDSVLFFPDANSKNAPIFGHVDQIGSIPCYVHTTCGAHVRLDDKFPKRFCPACGADTMIEARERGYYDAD